MKQRRLNIKRIIIVIGIILAILLSFFLIKGLMKPQNKDGNEPKIIGEINDYELRESASSYFKNVFNELKEELKKDEINEENYAKIITKLFISDCYTLDNKLNHNDIGGIQFVYEPFRNDFVLIASNSMYKHIENNIYGTRKQELPIVNNVNIVSIKQDKFEYSGKNDNEAYFVDVEIQYVKDLGYAKNATLVLIHNNNKLEVAELKS